jgi:hypothetical protein
VSRTKLKRLGSHARANAVAYAALFVALGGVAWAAADPLLDKRNEVNSRNLDDGTVKKRDLHKSLRKQLGLQGNPDAPNDGPYFGAFNGGNSGITIEIGGGNVVVAVLESGPNAPPACNFATSAYATIVNNHLTPSLIAVEIANSGSEVFQAQLQYVDSDTVSLSEATVTTGAGICLFPQDLELNAL